MTLSDAVVVVVVVAAAVAVFVDAVVPTDRGRGRRD